jgi:hypothetical protein
MHLRELARRHFSEWMLTPSRHRWRDTMLVYYGRWL